MIGNAAAPPSPSSCSFADRTQPTVHVVVEMLAVELIHAPGAIPEAHGRRDRVEAFGVTHALERVLHRAAIGSKSTDTLLLLAQPLGCHTALSRLAFASSALTFPAHASSSRTLSAAWQRRKA